MKVLSSRRVILAVPDEQAVNTMLNMDRRRCLSISQGYSTDAQIINIQVADELLMVKE